MWCKNDKGWGNKRWGERAIDYASNEMLKSWLLHWMDRSRLECCKKYSQDWLWSVLSWKKTWLSYVEESSRGRTWNDAAAVWRSLKIRARRWIIGTITNNNLIIIDMKITTYFNYSEKSRQLAQKVLSRVKLGKF
jgi:hypothetical protein